MTADRLEQLTNPATWHRDLAPASPEVVHELIPTPTDERTISYLGTAAARERIWLQCDALVDGVAAAGAVWAMLDSLTGKEVSQHRHLVLGRAYLAVVSPHASARRGLVPESGVPPLDAGAMGATPDILKQMRRFKPTLLVQVQDWTVGDSHEHPPSRSSQAGAPSAGGTIGMVDGPFRQIESYLLLPEVHARLAEPGAFRLRFGRPSAATRVLDGHPDARVAARTHRYMARMGFPHSEVRRGNLASGSLHTVVSIGRGRYLPRPEWRFLGGGNLAELALTSFGCMGLTAQLYGDSALARAGRTMAFIEGAILNRLNLDTREPES